MARYTVPLREIVLNHSNDLNIKFKDRIEVGRHRIFDDMDYEFFNEHKRNEFETHFLRYFWDSEIGHETTEKFLFELETWLQINMPYYNKLFETELIKYNPLENVRVRMEQDTDNKTSQDTETDSKGNRIGTTTQNTVFENTSDTDVITNEVSQTLGESDGTSDSVSKTETDISTSGNSETNATNESETNATNESETNATNESETNATGTSNTENSGKDSSFTRTIGSDTPDSRLGITAGNGTGAVNYASEITESNTNNENESDSTTNTTDNRATTGKNDSTTNTTDHSKTTGKNDSITNETSESNSITDGTTNTTTHDTTQTDSETDSTSDSFTTNKGTQTVTTNSREDNEQNTVAEMLGTSVTELEQFRLGKEGGQTYQSMILEFRQTFRRLEGEIFRDMKKDLFMLIY